MLEMPKNQSPSEWVPLESGPHNVRAGAFPNSACMASAQGDSVSFRQAFSAYLASPFHAQSSTIGDRIDVEVRGTGLSNAALAGC